MCINFGEFVLWQFLFIALVYVCDWVDAKNEISKFFGVFICAAGLNIMTDFAVQAFFVMLGV